MQGQWKVLEERRVGTVERQHLDLMPYGPQHQAALPHPFRRTARARIE
jgi:hypothetical protein